jgi:hypothetical protein
LDKASEEGKVAVLKAFESRFNKTAKMKVAETLREAVGQPSLDSYVDRVRGALGALPQEIRFIARDDSSPAVFESIPEASKFLEDPDPNFNFGDPSRSFVYQIAYTDGSEFERAVTSLGKLRELHSAIERLAQYVASLGA